MRRKKYEDNLRKVYDLVFSYFSKVMKNRIETSPTYESTIQYNSIKLLKTIKLMMHDPDRTKYAYTS